VVLLDDVVVGLVGVVVGVLVAVVLVLGAVLVVVGSVVVVVGSVVVGVVEVVDVVVVVLVAGVVGVVVGGSGFEHDGRSPVNGHRRRVVDEGAEHGAGHRPGVADRTAARIADGVEALGVGDGEVTAHGEEVGAVRRRHTGADPGDPTL
jgi:hypothetical protein